MPNIPAGVDAQSANFPLLEEGLEIKAHSVVTFACVDTGATLLGPRFSTCQSDGTWSRSFPIGCGKIRYF